MNTRNTTSSKPGLRDAQLWALTDFTGKVAIGVALIGVARVVGLFRSPPVTGSAVADAAVAFAVAATLGGWVWRRRHMASKCDTE